MAKNIFEDFDFETYTELLTEAKEDGIHLVHTFNKYYTKGGFTVAWQRAAGHKKCRMINVSVCFCSPNDFFARKIGAMNALADFYNGQKIQVSLGSEDDYEVVSALRNMFDADQIYHNKDRW